MRRENSGRLLLLGEMKELEHSVEAGDRLTRPTAGEQTKKTRTEFWQKEKKSIPLSLVN